MSNEWSRNGSTRRVFEHRDENGLLRGWLEHQTRALPTIRQVVAGALLDVATHAAGARDAITGCDDELATPYDATESTVGDAMLPQQCLEARMKATREAPDAARAAANVKSRATLYSGSGQIYGDDATGVADTSFLSILDPNVPSERRLHIDLDAPVRAGASGERRGQRSQRGFDGALDSNAAIGRSVRNAQKW